MKILAIITARSGSKRLPGKNIRQLGGKSLISWSIDSAKGMSEICDVLVSTDSEEIAKVSLEAGAKVPWLRPLELASDTAGSVEVCLHAIDWYEAEYGAVDGLLLLQPTSPFRQATTISRALAYFALEPHRAVVSMSTAASHPMWCYRITGNSITSYIDNGSNFTRSQDLPPALVLNGAIYLIQPDQLRSTRTFSPPNLQPLLIESPWESLDIDTPWDWFIAEQIADNLVDLVHL